MQTLNREADDFVGNESFHEMIDFPTVEELLAALDASFAQLPWLPRPVPVAVETVSQNLAQHWQEITEFRQELTEQDHDDHYLSAWTTDEEPEQHISVEPDFMLDFVQFLMERIDKRLREMRQAQHQLSDALAKLRV